MHGDPGPAASCAEGDIVGLDVGVELDGYYGDAAPHLRGGRGRATRRSGCCEVTREALMRGDRAGRGRATGSATSRTRSSRTSSGTGSRSCATLVGHGIGREMHEEPQVPELRAAGAGAEADDRAWCSPSSRW